MTAGELCNKDVVVARPEWSVAEAAQRMADYDVGDVVVIEDDDGVQVPVGVLTDRDIVMKVLAQDTRPWQEITIRSIMTREVLTAHRDENLSEVIERMKANSVRRLPVITDDGGLVGILSYDDIVEWLSEQMGNVATVARAAKSTAL